MIIEEAMTLTTRNEVVSNDDAPISRVESTN